MSLTLSSTVGRALTNDEIDANFTLVDSEATAQKNQAESSAAAASASAAQALSAAGTAAASAAAQAVANSVAAMGASQSAAAQSASNAATSEANALASKNAAASSATAAAGSATSAAADRATVQGILVTLNALYLGNKTSDPTKDNNGNALTIGSEYFNSTTKQMRVYTSTGWQDVDLTSENMAANATASASAASGSAAAASTSAAAALASQNAASASQTAAAGSATAASASQAAALASQNAAKTSETNSKTSETNSKTSETNAAASAAAAAATAATIGNPVSKDGDTMQGDLWVGDAAAVDTAQRTLGANYRIGVARSSAIGNTPYMVITNTPLKVASPPASQTEIGGLYWRWGSTTSDALAGATAADIHAYANADGSADLGFYARNASAVVVGRGGLTGKGNWLFGTNTDDGVSKVQINPLGLSATTAPALNAPTLRVADGGNGTAGGLSIDSFQPTIQFVDRSAGAKNSRMMQNAGQIQFSNDTAGEGTFNPFQFAFSPDGYMSIGGALSASVQYYAQGAHPGTGTTQYGFYHVAEFNAAATANGYAFTAAPKVKDAAFTMAQLTGFLAAAPTVGASATVTTYTAFNAKDFSSAGSVYGFRGQVAAGTNKWNLYNDGSALNYLNGKLLVGTTTDDGYSKLQVNGVVKGVAAQKALVASNGSGTGQTSMYLSREGAATNEKNWEVLHSSGNAFVIRSIDDTYATSQNALAINRPTGGGVALTTMQLMNGGGRVLVGAPTDDNTTLLQVGGAIKASSAITATGGSYVTGAAATYRGTLYQTSGVTRWSMGANATAESTNSGSDFSIDRYNDAGAWLDTPLSISRATGVLTLTQRPIWAGATPWDDSNLTPLDKSVGGTISAATLVDMVSSATTAHLSLKASSGAIGRESKLRFYGTFGTGTDTGQRMIASMHSGFTGAYGTEYLDFFLNNASNDAASDINQALVMRMTYGGRVLIGSATDDGANKLQVTGDISANAGAIRTTRYATSGALVLSSANGTASSPTAISAANSGIATVVGRGYDGSAYRDVAGIYITTDGAVSSTSSPGYLGFNTTPSGSVTSSERLRITSAGRVLIGTTTDDGSNLLQVNGMGSIKDFLNVTGVASSYKGIKFQSAGVARWTIGANQTTESSNAGADFSIDRYNDAGTWQSAPIQVIRASGLLNVNNGLNVAAGQGATFSGSIYATGGVIELGSLTGAMTPFIDFHSSGTGSDYDGRIIASGGNSTAGNGALSYTALAGHTFNGNVTVGNNGTYSYLLKFTAGSYSPFMRGNNTGGLEFVNSANNAYNMTLSDAGVLNLPRSRPTWAGATPWDTANLPSPAQTNGLIYTSSHLRTAGGVDTTWSWAGQGGTPSWVWGGSDGANMYVYNPANFSVNYANSANTANWATSAGSVGGVSNPASLSGAQFGGGISVASNANLNFASQGMKVVWNDQGFGDGTLVNNLGGGSGGFVFRTVNSNNTAELGRFSISQGGVGTNGSDRRLKKNIKTLKGSLAKIRAIRGVSYVYKASGEKHYGVIAQEIQEHFPDAVTVQGAGAGKGKPKADYLGVAYTDLVAPLIEAVKEVADKTDLIDPLAKAVKMLADKLDSALARIAALEGAAA